AAGGDDGLRYAVAAFLRRGAANYDRVDWDNKIVIADSGDGEAIALLAACLGCMVDGNVAMNGGDAAPGQQPYRDVAATNKNHWGVNWTGNAVDLPKQS
ncbi:hypothetical protein LCGC14_3146350, partial [marine sediment metagenome]